eukprot:403363149
MKINPKVLLIGIYLVVIMIATHQLQNNPKCITLIDDGINFMRDYGIVGMIIYACFSALLTALAIPLQFLDLTLGIVYTVQEATLILILSKMLGAAMTYYGANYIIGEETKKGYMSSKYIQGLQELVRREPFKYGLLLRFASIPIIIRNYGLALLPINFSTYMIVTFIQSSLTSPFQAFTASQFHSFVDFVSANKQNADFNPENLVPQFDEDGNLIELAPQHFAEPPKIFDGKLFILLGGILISLYIARKIKTSVDKINTEQQNQDQIESNSQEAQQANNETKKQK